MKALATNLSEALTFEWVTSEGTVLTLQLDSEGRTYSELLQGFINFLRAMGYVIPDEVDVV